jgi:hypothetical protein
MVHVVIDYDALVRGHAVSGEQCEIPGIGPIPVAVARQLSEDSILKVIVTKGVDVAGVAHGGRTIPAHLRSALEVRDPKCIVPRCDVRRGLQIDHRDTFGRTQVTVLDELARLCRWHHHQKTFLGYSRPPALVRCRATGQFRQAGTDPCRWLNPSRTASDARRGTSVVAS